MGSIFGGIETTRTAGTGGNYFTNGKHLCRVDRIKQFVDGKRTERVAIEFTVLKTIVPGDDGEHHNPGAEVSKLWEVRGIWFLSQFKQFMKIALGLEDADEETVDANVTAEACEAMMDEKLQPAAGLLMLVKGVPHLSAAGNLITKTSFVGLVRAHNAVELMGGDTDALRAAYPERTGFKSLDGFNARAAEEAKQDGIAWESIE